MGVDVYSTYQVQIRPGNPQDTPTFCKFQSQQSDIFQTDKHNVKEKVKSKNLDLAVVFEKLCCQIHLGQKKHKSTRKVHIPPEKVPDTPTFQQFQAR